MARKIKLSFYDKTYTLEYANRIEVKNYFAEMSKIKDDGTLESSIKGLVLLLKAGLIAHHEKDMPSDNDIERWATSIPNPKEFYETLMEMVREVVNVIEQDTKNLKWEVEVA